MTFEAPPVSTNEDDRAHSSFELESPARAAPRAPANSDPNDAVEFNECGPDLKSAVGRRLETTLRVKITALLPGNDIACRIAAGLREKLLPFHQIEPE